MKKLIVSLIAVLAIAFSANAASYKVDNNAIDALIEASSEVFTAEFMAAVPATPATAAVAPAGDVNNVTAFILSWLLGWCGIHRHYCGTAPWMWAVYLITGGGLGILWSVDTILLFLDVIGVGEGYLGKFINNQKIIAWI